MDALSVYQKLADVIDDWQAFLDMQRAWMNGPNATYDTNETDKGKRPIIDSLGNSVLVDTPAELERRIYQVIADLNLNDDNAVLELRVNNALADLDVQILEGKQVIADVESALPVAQQALSDVQAAQTQLNSLLASLTALRDAAVEAKNNALIYQQGALDSQLKAQAYRDEIKVQKFTLVSSKAAVAVTLPADYELVGLTVPGEAGFFVYDPSDLTTEVAADADRATYIAPETDLTGASGAWTRI